MIKENLQPAEKYVKFIEANDEAHPLLKVEIKVYDEPVAVTGIASIFTMAEILEEDGHRFGILLFETIFDEKEVKDLLDKIIADPMKFKTSSRTYEKK